MPISYRENYLRTLEFRGPEWIPMHLDFAPAVWHKYREDLEELVLRHPLIFGEYQRGSIDFDQFAAVYREDEYYTDNWGCMWYNAGGGMEGQVIESPLADWDALDTYQPPDPMLMSERGERDWEQIERNIAAGKQRGELTWGDGERLFDRLYFLRGFENLMIDIATDDPHLPRLIEMLTDYEMRLVGKSLEIGVDIMRFHTDIGTQKALMISPAKFRKYIKPMFMKIFRTCRDAGTHVALSSDGRLLEIVDDLIECGVLIHDPQLRANTLEGIIQAYKGKMCVNLDLDRQMFPFCQPEELRAQVEAVVKEMGSPQGGLMLSAWVTPDVPLENIEALAAAMEEFRTYWWDGRG